jgi:hypothetical protein
MPFTMYELPHQAMQGNISLSARSESVQSCLEPLCEAVGATGARVVGCAVDHMQLLGSTPQGYIPVEN